MKTRALLGASLLLAAVCACGGVTTATSAQLSGTYDVAKVGDLLFVTSSVKNELRVLDTAASPRDFVRAPNPLEALSIPVVDHPVELARDIRYFDGAPEAEGPYVYARGVGGAEISIVGAARDQLKELGRVIAPSTVTAIAGRGPVPPADPKDEPDPSTLYFATWDGERGTLWSVTVPPPDALPGATLAPTLVVTEEGEAIRSVAVMPGGKSLALATRTDAGDAGRTLILNLDDLSTRTMQFPAPVRRLLVQPRFVEWKEKAEDDIPHPAGATLFGVLDEASCGGQRRCQGVIAVETDTGEIAHDSNGVPMVPLTFGRGLISGVTLQPQGKAADPNASTGVFRFNLLGVVTTTGDSNLTGGGIYFFDAQKLRQENTNGANPELLDLAYADAESAERTYVNGPVESSFQTQVQNGVPIAFEKGAVHTQRLVITYQGIIPGLDEVPSGDADGQAFPAPGVDVPGRVAVGDSIHLVAPDPACTAELTVSSVEPEAVLTSDPIPSACHDRTGFTVRAAGAEPYVVEGSVEGYLGRVGPNETFTWPAPATFSQASPACPTGAAYCPIPCPPGQQAACAPADDHDYSAAYFYHPPTFFSKVPGLFFAFGAGDPDVQRGFQYSATLSGNYRALGITLDSSVFSGWYLPGSVAYIQRPQDTKDTDPHRATFDFVYVAYPSIQGVLEFDPGAIVPNAANAANLVGYR